jgi:hypothetical protein
VKFKYKAGPDAPGYLRKFRKHYQFLQKLKDIKDPVEQYEELIEWLVEYVTWPPFKFLKRYALRRASENDIEELRQAVLGEYEIDPKESANSEDG